MTAVSILDAALLGWGGVVVHWLLNSWLVLIFRCVGGRRGGRRGGGGLQDMVDWVWLSLLGWTVCVDLGQ